MARNLLTQETIFYTRVCMCYKKNKFHIGTLEYTATK